MQLQKQLKESLILQHTLMINQIKEELDRLDHSMVLNNTLKSIMILMLKCAWKSLDLREEDSKILPS